LNSPNMAVCLPAMRLLRTTLPTTIGPGSTGDSG
jgi:hypothetical protein